MKNIDKKKKILLLCIIGCLLLTFSVSLAIFKYSKLGNNSSLVLGDIYMSSKEDSIVLNKLEPMSPNEGIEKGSKYNFSVEGYNTSNKNIYYGVYLNYGSEETGKTRFKDEDMMMYLTETKNGETKAVYGPGSVKDFNDKMIYASTIDSDTKKDEKIEIDYELTVWLSDNILISDTEESYEGKNIYTTSEYENGYASIDVKVYGDFEEKNIKKASENITATTVSTGTSYEIKDDIKDSKEIDEDVKIVITTTKEAKLYLTNLETGLKEEKTLTLKNNLYTFEKIETDKSRYSYYFEYSDSTISQIYYYNINIKKYENISKPTNVLCKSDIYNGNMQSLTNIDSTNAYELINNYQKDVGEYTVTAKLKSGFLWSDNSNSDVTFKCNITKKDLIIKPNTLSKNYLDADPTLTYTYSGNIEGETPKFSGTLTREAGEEVGTYLIKIGTLSINDNQEFKVSNYNLVFTKEEVKFSILEKTSDNLIYELEYSETTYDGLEKKPNITIKNGNKNLVNGTDCDITYKNNINVGNAVITIKFKGSYTGTIEKTFKINPKGVSIPTNSYCNTLTYNGASQTLTKTEGEGYTFSNTSGVNATSYTVTAKLKANYIWSDKTTTDKTFTCSIAKKSVAVTWNNPTLTYNGSDQAPTPSVSSDVTGETINLSKTTGKNAGNYTSTASCSSVTGGSATCNNYTLTNNTKSFTINKATATLNISSTSLTTTYGTNTSYTYTYSGDGTSFTCTSSNTAVATCSIDTTNKKVTITPVKVGTATITLSVSAGTNYNASSKVTNITINGITRTVTYTKGTGVSAISKTSDSCVTTGNATSCTVTLPTITAATGYTADGWYLDSTKVGSQSTTYTLTANRTLSAKTTVNVYTATFDTDVKIYNENTSSWTMHASTAIDNSSTYGNTTGVKVYSNTSKFTGLNIPIINFKQNTNYLLSVRAKKIGDFSGNLRVYATTYDSSNTVISYNHGITITSSNINTSNWTYFYYLFNSGSASSMPKIQIDYDTASTGPVHISDIRLTEVRGLNISYGAQLGTLFSPTIKGYTYNGWYTGKNGGGTKISETTTMPAANTAYYAYYSPKTYTINYLANGGTGTMSATTATYATTISIKTNAFTKSGYSFAGWTTKSDNTNDNYGWTNWSGVWIYDNGEYGVTNNTLNLYARWNPYYCATFNANGASSISKTSACCTATNGSSCTVTVPTITPKTNFEVLGWTDNASDLKTPTQLVYNDDGTLASITLTGNKTYYAVTKSTDDANKKYNIEFNLNGSDSYTISGVTYKQTSTFECQNQSVYNGATIPTSCSYTLPTITRSGGTVYGWDKNDSNQGTPTYKVGQTISISDDISLSAITSRPITLSYDANGGTTTLTSQTAQVYNDDEGAWFNIPAYDNANMCRTKTSQYVGYKYVGLGTSSGSSVTSNCQGSRAYLTQNTTLYALWKTYYATASHSVSSGLIIRSSESTSASKVTTIPKGVKVYVTGPLGSCKSSHKWYPVIYGTYSGYSSAGASCSSTVNFSNFSYVADSSCSTSYACSGTNYNMTASPSKIVLNIKTGVLSQKITVDAQCGSYTFASSDTSVVTVASDGTVSTTSSAVAEGAQKTAKINITSAGKCTASVDVVVKNITETAPTVNVSISGTAQSSGYRSGATATVTCTSAEGIASFAPKDSKGGSFTITGDNYTKTATITLTGGSSGRTISATCKSNNDLSASASKTTKIYVYSASSACGVSSYSYSGTCTCNTSALYSKSCNSNIYNIGGCSKYCSQVYFTTGSGTCSRTSNYKSCYHT